MLSSETSDFLLLRFTSEIFFVTGFFLLQFSCCPFVVFSYSEKGILYCTFCYGQWCHTHFDYLFGHVLLFVLVVRYQAIQILLYLVHLYVLRHHSMLHLFQSHLSQKSRCPSCLCAHVENVFSLHPLNRNKFHNQCISPLVLLY